VKRTTILTNDALLIEVKHLAHQQGMTVTALVQQALREYIDTHQPSRRFAFVGMGDSGDVAIAERDEEILAAEIDPVLGWSPRPRADSDQDGAAGPEGEP
jgi:hypothetical protein